MSNGFNSQYTGPRVEELLAVAQTGAIHVGDTAPTNNDIKLWYDTDEPDQTIVTSVNGATGAVNLLDFVYPIGSIYMSVNNISPTTLFGGTWEQISGKFLLACDSSHVAGSSGGADSVVSEAIALTTNQIPAHTHDKGTFSIPGSIRCFSEYNKGNSSFDNQVTGAFYFRTGTDTEWGSSTNLASGSNDAVRVVNFEANRSWTGNSGSTGGSATHAHTVSTMPPYLSVYMWQRTA